MADIERLVRSGAEMIEASKPSGLFMIPIITLIIQKLPVVRLLFISFLQEKKVCILSNVATMYSQFLRIIANAQLTLFESLIIEQWGTYLLGKSDLS